MAQHYATRTPLNPRLARLADATAEAARGRPPAVRRSFIDLAIAALIGAVIYGALIAAFAR